METEEFNRKVDYIFENIGTYAFLEQMAEECCELGQACLKLNRAAGNGNPTPVSWDEAYENFKEEYIDVLLCMLMVENFPIDEGLDRKLDRWVRRIENGTNARFQETE